ncbi:hypothetical protein [Sphingobium sp. C100]|uniref:hypothetical protein n=1 Tax=Sphingobium sp. C100 TaxID=1207055 RepID=UPI0012684853|nr:hypothetical protein [Sphingobium sp. C100]
MKKRFVLGLFLPLALMAACNRKAEWTDTWPTTLYHFNDAEPGYVALNCMGTPVLALLDGDYPADATHFTLSIDGTIHPLGIFRGQHGRGMIIDDEKIVASFAAAKREITFRVGKDWARSVPPDPRLQSFSQRCLTHRAQD